MSIEPFSTAIIEVAKQSIKEIGKGISDKSKIINYEYFKIRNKRITRRTRRY